MTAVDGKGFAVVAAAAAANVTVTYVAANTSAKRAHESEKNHDDDLKYASTSPKSKRYY